MSQQGKSASGLPAWLAVSVGVILGAIVLVLIFIVLRDLNSPEAESIATFEREEPEFDGIDIIDPARDMPDFTLISHLEEPIQRSDLDGRYSLLFFGFTNCPDICPLTLNEFRNIRNLLAEDADAVNFVMISVDGARDTPQVLARNFDVRNVSEFMIGMTGTEEAVRELGVDYGVRFVYGEANANGSYTVDHTASSFLLDPEGRWIRRYAFGTDPQLIAEDLQTLISTDTNTTQ